MKWISVKDKLPECRKEIIAFYLNSHGKERMVIAVYIPQFTVHCCDFYDHDAEYDEEFMDGDDEGFVKESWHEIAYNWPEFSGFEIVEGVVTHWMEKPPAPTK